MSPIIRGAILDAEAEAARILEAAERKARELTAQAEAALATARAEARTEAHAQGHAEVAALLVRARQTIAAQQAQAQDQLMRFAVRMAERIVASELALRPDAIVAICAAAVSEAPSGQPLTVRVHPQDEAAARAGLQQPGVAIVVDGGVRRGGCVVEGERGEVDARLETQLGAFERALVALGGDSEHYDDERYDGPRGNPGERVPPSRATHES